MFETLDKKQNFVSLPQEKKQRKLLGLLIILILAILAIVFFYFRSSSSEQSITIVKDQGSSERIVEKIDFDINFLKNSFFQSLKIYGEWPLEINEKGRTNPFLIY